jgi:hypothetical protein
MGLPLWSICGFVGADHWAKCSKISFIGAVRIAASNYAIAAPQTSAEQMVHLSTVTNGEAERTKAKKKAMIRPSIGYCKQSTATQQNAAPDRLRSVRSSLHCGGG